MGENFTLYTDATPIMGEEDPLEAIINLNGKRFQMMKAVEELAELSQAICKYLLYDENPVLLDHLAEEYTDVSIMLDQIDIIFKGNDDFQAMRKEHYDAKMKRIKGLVQKEKEWRNYYGNQG